MAEAVRVHRSDNLSTTLQNWGFVVPQSALVLVGGASGISEEGMVMLRSLFTDALAPLVQRFNIPVIDGGTDAGIMKLIGQARHFHGSTFPLIGVAAIGTVILPGNSAPPPPDGAELEPNHTHFLLVPGALWGDEAPWIARTASALATGMPSVTILVNGGKIAWQDVLNSVRANRPVIVIAGSGRTADELTAAIRGEFISEMAEEMVDSGLLQAIDLADGLDTITQTLMRLLSVPQSRVS
ncbi:MAG TPA: hypothetical protein V6C88_20215 [Chroococcidiopsis sp.]